MRQWRFFPWLAVLLNCVVPTSTALAAPPVVDDHFKIDQFGYRPGDVKVAVIADPQSGFNAPDAYTPAAVLEVRRWTDDSVAWSGPVSAWGGGVTHAQSGDRVWWLDFGALTETGSFYVYDPSAAIGSFRFEIADDVYAEAMRQALRSFYYQRCGSDRPAIYAGTSWADGPCHVGLEQDLDCRAVLNPVPQTSRDLSGGWHDAGDYNKYINFADGPVHDLLAAYEGNPGVWDEDLGIPESGNCVPDLLDEVKFELDWFLRMQLPDGSVLHKVSVESFDAASPPSADTTVRRFAPPTASATISATGVFAHAAIIYRSLTGPTMQAYAMTLELAGAGSRPTRSRFLRATTIPVS